MTLLTKNPVTIPENMAKLSNPRVSTMVVANNSNVDSNRHPKEGVVVFEDGVRTLSNLPVLPSLDFSNPKLEQIMMEVRKLSNPTFEDPISHGFQEVGIPSDLCKGGWS